MGNDTLLLANPKFLSSGLTPSIAFDTVSDSFCLGFHSFLAFYDSVLS